MAYAMLTKHSAWDGRSGSNFRRGPQAWRGNTPLCDFGVLKLGDFDYREILGWEGLIQTGATFWS